jgi:presenilin-like A22 family membrane protease
MKVEWPIYMIAGLMAMIVIVVAVIRVVPSDIETHLDINWNLVIVIAVIAVFLFIIYLMVKRQLEHKQMTFQKYLEG